MHAGRQLGFCNGVALTPDSKRAVSNLATIQFIGEYFGGGRPDHVELARQIDSENCLVLNVLTVW